MKVTGESLLKDVFDLQNTTVGTVFRFLDNVKRTDGEHWNDGQLSFSFLNSNCNLTDCLGTESLDVDSSQLTILQFVQKYLEKKDKSYAGCIPEWDLKSLQQYVETFSGSFSVSDLRTKKLSDLQGDYQKEFSLKTLMIRLQIMQSVDTNSMRYYGQCLMDYLKKDILLMTLSELINREVISKSDLQCTFPELIDRMARNPMMWICSVASRYEQYFPDCTRNSLLLKHFTEQTKISHLLQYCVCLQREMRSVHALYEEMSIKGFIMEYIPHFYLDRWKESNYVHKKYTIGQCIQNIESKYKELTGKKIILLFDPCKFDACNAKVVAETLDSGFESMTGSSPDSDFTAIDSAPALPKYTEHSKLWDCFGPDAKVGDVFDCCDFNRDNDKNLLPLAVKLSTWFDWKNESYSELTEMTVKDFGTALTKHHIDGGFMDPISVNPEKLSQYVEEHNTAVMEEFK